MSDKLDLKTPDIVNINIERIAALFPHCVVETECIASPDTMGHAPLSTKKIDFDLLRQELSTDIVEGPKERYRLEWPGKREAIVTANMSTTNTLRPVREDSVNFDTTENLYIEGDNLEVLKLLQESYLGKVKMIYIDPPYNTGNDFVYRDNFAQDSDEYKADSGMTDELGNRLVANPETAGRYHSDWLTMMYPRLKLARNLLTDDGVIFISIDDNEVHNLRKMCDEVFGEVNFVGDLIIQTATDNNPGQIKTEHEYMVCFAKNKSNLTYWYSENENAKLILEQYIKLKQKYHKPNEIEIELRKWIKSNEKKLKGVTHYDNVDEKGVFHDGDIANTVFGGYEYEVIHPVTGRACKIPEKGFRFPETTLTEMIENDDLMFGIDETTLIKPKKRIENAKDVLRTVIYEDGRTSTKKFETLMGRDIFQNPKSETILSRLINFICKDDDIILDFFSGSATTAESVMNNNSMYNHKLKFILVQLPENLDNSLKTADNKAKKTLQNAIKFLDSINKPHIICEIGKERIRRAGKLIAPAPQTDLTPTLSKGEGARKGEKESAPNLFSADSAASDGVTPSHPVTKKGVDIGFRVYRLDTSNMQDVYYRPQDYKQGMMTELFANHIKPDRTADDLVAQVMLDWGLPLSLPIEQTTIAGKTVYKVAGNALYCCFDEGIDEVFVRALVSPTTDAVTTDGVTPSHPVSKELPLRIVFHDYAFADDTAKENVRQLLKQLSAETEMRVI